MPVGVKGGEEFEATVIGGREEVYAVALTSAEGAFELFLADALDVVCVVGRLPVVAVVSVVATFSAGAGAVVAADDGFGRFGDVDGFEFVVAGGAVYGDDDVGVDGLLGEDVAGGRGDDFDFDLFDADSWAADGVDVDAVPRVGFGAGVEDDEVLAGEIGEARGRGSGGGVSGHAGVEGLPVVVVGDDALVALGDAGVETFSDG